MKTLTKILTASIFLCLVVAQSQLSDNEKTVALLANSCYNQSVQFDGKNITCYILRNPSFYWIDSNKTSYKQWGKDDIKLWLQHYVDYHNSLVNFLNQNVPYLHSVCVQQGIPMQAAPNVTYDPMSPGPASNLFTPLNFTQIWPARYDKLTAAQIGSIFTRQMLFYEDVAFFQLFYGNNSVFYNISQNMKALGLPPIKNDSLYRGENSNYTSSQSKASPYALSQTIYSFLNYTKAIRQIAQAAYITSDPGTDYSVIDVKVNTSDIDKILSQICHIPPPTAQKPPAPSLGDIANYGADYVLTNLEAVGLTALTWVTGIGNDIRNGVEYAYDSSISALSNAGSVVVSGLETTGKVLESGFVDFAGAVQDYFSIVADTAAAVGVDISNVASDVGNGIVSVANTVGGTAVDVGNQIASGVENLGNTIASGFCGFFGC